MQHVTTAAVKVTMATGIVIVILAVSTAFVTFMQDGSLSLLPRTVKADSVIGAIPVGNGPMGIAYDSANGNVYVANFYSNTISVISGNTNAISGSSNAVVATIRLSPNASPVDIAYDSANGNLYVTNYNTGTVSVINGNTNTVTGIISGLSPGAFAITFNPSNGNLYVTNYNTGTVSVINGNTNTVIAKIFVGGNPAAITANPANGDVYVSNGINAVGVINSVTNSLVDAVSVGYGPYALAFDSVNGDVYVANFYSNTISVVDGNTNNVIDTIPLYYGGAINPSGIVYNPADNHLYVTNYYNTGNSGVTIGGSATTTIGGIVSVIDGNTNNVIANMVVGNAPQDVAFNSANGQAYVTNFLSNSVSVISSSSIVNPVQSIQALIQSIQSTTTISQGIQLSLISTLNTALSILSTGAPGSYIAACNQLNVFNNQVYGGVQYGLIDQITGLQLVQSSQAIQQALGC